MKLKPLFLTALLLVVLLAGGLLWTRSAAAQPETPSAPFWLPFDGASGPGVPRLSLAHADGGLIELRADLPGAWAEALQVDGQGFTRLYGDGYGFPLQVGLPALPVLRQEVEIPFGASVTLELVSAEYADHSLSDLGLNPIYPMQAPLLKLEGIEDDQPFAIDQAFYARGGRYPEGPLSLGDPYIVRGRRILPVEVTPVAYDPSVGSLRLYSHLTFHLRLSGSDMARTQALAERYASPAFEASLSQRLLNYNQGRPAPTFAPDTTVGYLIISADSYYDNMLPFVDLRESRGYDVTITRLSDVPGSGSASDIKAYIQEAYDTWPVPPSYVLLVGDTNTLPTWNGPIIGTSTDLYYGTMDGPDDWHPDIGRGRFPVRSPAQTTYMVDKYLAYAQLTGQEPWIKTASFAATCDLYTIAEGTHNYVIDNYTLPGGYIGTFPNNPQPGGDKLYCITYNADHQDLLDAFNQGRWAIIYSGHGSYNGWEMDFTPTDVQNLTNYGMFPFVASHACLSGDFGQTEVFGETWVLQEDKGALVYWGSSTYSYWDEDDVLERAMFDSLFEVVFPHTDVATMTDFGLAAVESDYPGSARYYWETYNVLGDPAVRIFLEPDLPTFTLDVDPDSHEVCSAGTLTSTVEIGSLQGYSETVSLLTGALPVNVTAAFDPAQAQAPYSSTLTLEVSSGAPLGDHAIAITATDWVSWTLDTWLDLRIVGTLPSAPTLLDPPDGAIDQPIQPTLAWETLPLVSRYGLQLDTGPLFPAPLVDISALPQASYTLPDPLVGGRCYWWRARGENACGSGQWAEPFHFATVALELGFSDDMESGTGNWAHSAAQGIDHWALSTAQSHSPTHAWYVPDDNVVTDSRLWIVDPIPVGNGSTLTFWHRHQFESSYDGAVLEISTNGGATWTDLGPYITANGYNGTISTCCSNPLGGRQAWVDDLTTWTQVEVDLSSFAGQNVMIRWRFGADSSVSDVGWYIDDVQVTSPLQPNPAPLVTGVVPNSGSAFEPTPVEILGENFIETPAVRLGETWLLSVTQVSTTTLEAVVPAGLPGGAYTLTLYNGDCQQALLPDAFSIVTHAYPVVLDDAAETIEDTPVAIDVLANDYDPEGAPLQFVDLGTPAHGSVALSDTLVLYTPDLDFYGLDTFIYTVSDGDLHGSATVSVTVSPVNDPPTFGDGALSLVPASIAEGQAVTLTALLDDPDPLDPHTVLIQWGDGLSDTQELTPGLASFAAIHTYLDDPTSLEDIYPISVTVSDGLALGSAAITLTVDNLAPVLSALPDRTIDTRVPLTFTAAFTDPGLLDAHTVTLEWAPGVTQTLELAAGLAQFTAAHIYDLPGTYLVTVTLHDDDGAHDTRTFTVLVTQAVYEIMLPIVRR